MATQNSVNLALPSSSTDTSIVTWSGTGASALLNNSTALVTAGGVVQSAGISFDSGTTTMANYVKGTWSPVLSFGGASTGITYTTQSGIYWRIGAVVNFSINILLSSKGSSTGSVALTAPLSSAATNVQVFTVWLNSGGTSPYPGTSTMLVGALDQSSTNITIFGVQTTGFTNVTNSQFANTSELRISGTYWVA